MAGASPSSQYSSGVAFIYIFNLFIGTGMLALPSVLNSGGWLLGGIFILTVAFLSYVTVTFMLQSMATTNALIRLDIKGEGVGSDGKFANDLEKSDPLLLPLIETKDDINLYEITEKTELGQMASLYYNNAGLIVFYVVLVVYFFGDGVINSTMVVNSLLSFIYGPDAPSWAFDFFLSGFFIFILPFCLSDFQKTKLLQMVTMVIRNISLVAIIAVGLYIILKGPTHEQEVVALNLRALPNLFGGAVYSFMCHHSLPGIITPMKDKSKLITLTWTAFLLVTCIYVIIFIMCLFAFGNGVSDPFTLNFSPEIYGFLGNFLILFPVFTRTSAYPMLVITLRNNLDNLFQLLHKSPKISSENHGLDLQKGYSILQRHVALTLVAVSPSIICTFIGEHMGISIDELVGITGAFAGCCIMFIIPATLVSNSRRVLKDKISSNEGQARRVQITNIHASPFSGSIWVYLVLVWAVVAMAFNATEKFSVWLKTQ